MDTERFAGKVAIVTGGASGIGEATARRLHAEGGHIVIADIRASAADALAAELGDDRAFVHVVDMMRVDAVEGVIASTADRFCRIDLLVNNAGMGSFGRVTDISVEHWRDVMTIDVEAVFVASRAVIPHLQRTRGTIVNVASVAGMFGDHSFAAYSAAKAAVINLTRSMAIDHAPDIRVNCVSPGLTATPLATGLTDNAEIMAAYAPCLMLQRPASPAEIASGIAFLASPDASYITGHNLVIDGGMTAHTGQPNFTRILAGEKPFGRCGDRHPPLMDKETKNGAAERIARRPLSTRGYPPRHTGLMTSSDQLNDLQRQKR